MVSKLQWKPFWLASQLYPQNDWTGWQNGVDDDVCIQAPRILTMTDQDTSSCLGLPEPWHAGTRLRQSDRARSDRCSVYIKADLSRPSKKENNNKKKRPRTIRFFSKNSAENSWPCVLTFVASSLESTFRSENCKPWQLLLRVLDCQFLPKPWLLLCLALVRVPPRRPS